MNPTAYRLLLAMSAMLPSHLVASTHAQCPAFKLDFDESYIKPGDYITDILKNDYKVTISASGGYTPGGAARIFDTSNPVGDPDLGTPNKNCPGGGPGVGDGGKPGTDHSNCSPLGNVLIVQEGGTSIPDDNAGGGQITFKFDDPAYLESLTILDVDKFEKAPTIITTQASGAEKSFNARKVGNNGVDTVAIDVNNVVSVKVIFAGSGSVAELNYNICPKNGTGGGDPHFRTYDGTEYSYHGECDLVMARSQSFGDGLGLDLHARTKGMGTWSLISNAALRIGHDILELENDGSLYINGSPLTLPYAMAGQYEVTKDSYTFNKIQDDGEVEAIDRLTVIVDLGEGKNAKMSLVKGMVYVRVNAYLEDSEGMLGSHKMDGMVGRDLTVLADPNEMGEQWQVRDTEAMLFREVRFPQYPQVCVPPTTTGRRLRQSPSDIQNAEKACAEVDDSSRHFCIQDVLLTGDANAADAYMFGEAF